MSVTLSPSKAAYLARVAEGLTDLPAEDRDEVIQDLQAHLAEMEDGDVGRVLGSPEAFVSEFRFSAGLDVEPSPTGPGLIERLRAALDRQAARLGEFTRCDIQAGLDLDEGLAADLRVELPLRLRRIQPIPHPHGGREHGHRSGLGARSHHPFTVAGPASIGGAVARGWIHVVLCRVWPGLVGMLLNPIPTYSQLAFIEEPLYFEELTDPEGNPIWSQGTVDFSRDRFGRIIPNLYPLAVTMYDEYGNPVPMAPPSLGWFEPEQEGRS